MMQRLSDNILMLGNRHFKYFVVGQKHAAIVECGVTGGVSSFRQEWIHLYQTPEVRNILVMHEHFDHVCGIPALKELFPGVPVLGHAKTARVLGKESVVADFFCQDDKMSDVLVASGILPKKPVSHAVENIQIDGFLAEGDILEVDSKVKFNIMEAPGHSPGSICAYFKDEQLMCLSDVGGYQITDESIFPIFFQGYEMYIDSIERMSTYPARILALPHGRIWTGVMVHLFYRRALEAAQKAYEYIRTMLDDGVEESAIEEKLFKRYYRDDLMIYTPANIRLCVKLLVKRVKECL